MIEVRVNAGKGYAVRIKRGIICRLGAEMMRVIGKPCKIALISDDTVSELYGDKARKALAACGFDVRGYVMPHGEKHKTLAEWEKMLRFMSESGLTRTDCVIALGGGVVGDMAGFAAASCMRGVRLVHVPTTLLAMVDSSVGGKTGCNLAEGKNLVGAFYQPEAVFCDPDALDTLPGETLADGMAEAVKYGVLGDTELFELLSSGGLMPNAERVIARCAGMKAALVASDERDLGERVLLNLGHTFGHAIEKLSGYEVTHGHAVAVGMARAAVLARELGLCDAETAVKIRNALTANGLPFKSPFSAQELAEAAMRDKKRSGRQITLVLPKRIGECVPYRAEISDLPRLMRLSEGEI